MKSAIKKHWKFSGAIAFSLLLSACVQFKTASLYSGVEPKPVAEKPATINSVVEPVIFDDDASNMWGMEKTVCKNAFLTSKYVYSGTKAIAATWDRNAKGCDFAGFGIGWDDYVGKDLTPIMKYAAIQFYVRTQHGVMYGLPIVLTLEDYSGGMGFAYTYNKYFQKAILDTTWQKVVVPLSDFDIKKEHLDPSNIKQLQFELQQSGDIYLDDVKLVFYTPEPQKPWLGEQKIPNPLATPITIFDEGFIHNNGWGLMKNSCEDFRLDSTQASSGRLSIHATWNNTESCKPLPIGASWDEWNPMDLSGALNTTAFQFDIKVVSGGGNEVPVKIGMNDFSRASTYVQLTSQYVKGGVYDNQWHTVTIPLSAFKNTMNFKDTKQVLFSFEKSGDIYLDNLKFISIK